MLDLDDTTAPADDPAPSDEAPGAAAEMPEDATEPGDAGTSDPASDGPPRDDRGRFAPKGPTDPATGAAAATAPEDPDAPAADPDAPDAAPPATDAPPEAPPGVPPDQGEPYAFPHRGQMHGIEGAIARADGAIVIPATARQRAELLMTRGRELETAFPQWQRERQALTQQVAERHAGVEAFTALFADNPDAETFLARALTFFEQLPALREKLTQDELTRRDRRIAELEGRAPASASEPAAGPSPEEIARGVDETITSGLTQARTALAEFKEFTDAELLALQPELRRRAGLFIRAATPDDEARHGVAAGELVFDEDAYVHELRLVAGPALQQKRAAAAKAQRDKAVAEAATRNKRVLTPPKVPPAPRPGGESTGEAAPEFENMEDFRRWSRT